MVLARAASRAVARLALAALAIVLILIPDGPVGEAASAAPVLSFVSARPDLSPPRPSRRERVPEPPSARGGEREERALTTPATPPSRIGLQVGHWRAAEAGWPFSSQLGASGRGMSEAEVNLPIAEAAAGLLRAAGHTVEVLPTLIPRGYRADLVVAVHADGGPSSRRGYFVDHSPRAATAAAEERLARAITDAYAAVGIPNVFRGTQNSRYYYGYYAVDAQTPMVLIETGFLTNALDQLVIVDQPELAGGGIAQGILDYLARPLDGP